MSNMFDKTLRFSSTSKVLTNWLFIDTKRMITDQLATPRNFDQNGKYSIITMTIQILMLKLAIFYND